MVTKYTTGQQILIPATIRDAREVNGQIIYGVDTGDLWEGIAEDQIVVDDKVAARAAFAAGVRDMMSDINNRYFK